jgi:hypothetical protein
VCKPEEEISQRREQLRRILDELSDAGDLVSLPEGRWLPAPTREVILNLDSDERLIVGGVPTNVLPKELRRQIVHHGPYRRVMGPALGDALELPKESMTSWTRGLDRSIVNWSEEILNVELVPYQEPYDGSRLRIYAPELITKGSLQINRWCERPKELSGRYLAVRERVFGVKEFRIVELKRGTVVASNDCLAPGDARRLMYALDSRANKPVEIQFGVKGGRFFIVLRSELPRSEQRLFGALGTLVVPEGAYYPRTWWFAECYRTIITQALLALGVILIESKGRRQ